MTRTGKAQVTFVADEAPDEEPTKLPEKFNWAHLASTFAGVFGGGTAGIRFPRSFTAFLYALRSFHLQLGLSFAPDSWTKFSTKVDVSVFGFGGTVVFAVLSDDILFTFDFTGKTPFGHAGINVYASTPAGIAFQRQNRAYWAKVEAEDEVAAEKLAVRNARRRANRAKASLSAAIGPATAARRK